MGNPFKLQSVLNYRNILEQEAQQQLAGALKVQGELMAQLTRQRAELRYMCDDLEQKKQAGLSMSELSLINTHLTLRGQQVAALEEELDVANRQVILLREDLMRTAQDRKMVEKLKDRHQESDRREQNRLENIVLDEIALQDRNGGLT